MSDYAYETPYKFKHHIKREQGIPDEFPFKVRFPAPDDIPEDAPEVYVGMDSGVGNTAFSYIELIKNPDTNAVIDFNYTKSYYYAPELAMLIFQIDKQFFLMEQYYDLFAHKRVASLTYELLPLTNIKDYETLKGVIDAQSTTNMLNALAYSLNHPYKPTPATSIKYCLTGNGKATKEEMCQAAYAITDDEELLKNNHMADAFADCFYAFIQRLKEDCAYYSSPVPEKWATKFDWNFKTMPKAPWKK